MHPRTGHRRRQVSAPRRGRGTGRRFRRDAAAQFATHLGPYARDLAAGRVPRPRATARQRRPAAQRGNAGPVREPPHPAGPRGRDGHHRQHPHGGHRVVRPRRQPCRQPARLLLLRPRSLAGRRHGAPGRGHLRRRAQPPQQRTGLRGPDERPQAVQGQRAGVLRGRLPVQLRCPHRAFGRALRGALTARCRDTAPRSAPPLPHPVLRHPVRRPLARAARSGEPVHRGSS